MSEQFTERRFKALIEDLFSPGGYDMSSTPEDLELDSLDIVELALQIEDELVIDIPDSACEHWYNATFYSIMNQINSIHAKEYGV